MKRHVKSSRDPYECPQGPGETWRYFYKDDYLIVTTVSEASGYDEDGWNCVVLHGGAWNYTPGAVLDWGISARVDWEKVE